MRLLRRALLLLVVLTLLLLGAVAGLMQSYSRLSAETLIAELTFERLNHQRYRAQLATGDLCRVKSYPLWGDQWRIDARFLKWKPWANVLGLDGRFRLDRLEGRYREVEQQNSAPTRAHSLADVAAAGIVDGGLTEMAVALLADASYGSSTYESIDTERIYQVFKTQSGLITRSRSRRAERDEDGRLVIEITRACPPH